MKNGSKGSMKGVCVCVQAHNPYEARYPGLRVISREELHLVKMIRASGGSVSISGDSSAPVYYVTRKGFRDFISDPLYAFVTCTLLSPFLGMVGNWLTDVVRRSRTKDRALEDTCNILITVDEDGRTLHYTHRGEAISDERFNQLIALLQAQQDAYAVASMGQRPPNDSRPYPVFLEHQSIVVGWTNLRMGQRALQFVECKITDDETLRRINAGELRGASIGVIVTNSECSICGYQYAECNHITGHRYKGKECTVGIKGLLLGDISIVKEPVNPKCLVELARSASTAPDQPKHH